MERFLRWRAERKSSISIDFVVGYSYDFPELTEYIEFYRQWGMTASHCLQVNGIQRRSGDELKRFLDALRGAGVRQIGMSFYGVGKSHDEFARRDGDFDFLVNIARTLANCGMQRFETIFLRKGTTQEIPALLAQLDSIPGCNRRYLLPWDYRGRGKSLEEERPDLRDIEPLPEEVSRLINRDRYRSEAEWLDMIESGGVPEKKYRHFFVSIWEENIKELETEDCDVVLVRLRRADDAFNESVPSLVTLADSFGQEDDQRIYALRDLEWKWQDMYLDRHPELHGLQRFDDLQSCVLRK